MTITAAMVKELRELTGAGVMACKKALVETDGDQEAAIEILRKKGEATAVKKSGRIAAEGVVFTAVKDGKAAIVEVNSETDFVAKNEKFQTFVSNVANQILDSDAADMDTFMAEPWALDTTKTVKDELVSQIMRIIRLKRNYGRKFKNHHQRRRNRGTHFPRSLYCQRHQGTTSRSGNSVRRC